MTTETPLPPLPAVTDDTFVAAVVEADRPVLVHLTAAWCGPCRRMRPLLQRLAAERDLRVVTLDTDANPATAARLGVLSLPTMLLFRGGAPVRTVVGARPYSRLVRDLEDAL